MRYQDQVVRLTQKALDDVCRSALAVPADKANWSPMGDVRPILSQMQEIAVGAKWFLPIVQDMRMTERGQDHIREAMEEAASLETIESCVEKARTTTTELCRAIADFPDGALEDEITLPFGGGLTVSMADLLHLHAWNMTYHLGQINQIQLMLGDREMH